MQHEIRSIHTALDEENQLLPDERCDNLITSLRPVLCNLNDCCRIDGEHNRKVVDCIVREVRSTKYTRRQIQGA